MCQTNAEIIAVGTELLLGQILNTNAKFLSEALADLGINLFYQTVVGDNPGRMADVFSLARHRSDLILVTGGLGPTMDDITKDVLAELLGRRLEFHEPSWSEIDAFFKKTGRVSTDNNRRQAYVPEGAIVLENPFGTAPGLIVEDGHRAFVLMPGPPREMVPMWNYKVKPYLFDRGFAGKDVIHSALVRICGIGESSVEDMVKDLITGSVNPTIAPYASLGEVQLRVTAKTKSREEAEMLVGDMVSRIGSRLGDHVFGLGQTTLEEAIGHRLLKARWTLSLAESCTGGLLGHRITSVPGSSAYYIGGVMVYSNEAKVKLLGVSEQTLKAHGAVSKETAIEMAQGVRRALETDVGIAVTGIAGPGGGVPGKQVGTVHIGISTPKDTLSSVHTFRPPRADVKWRASQQAFTELWLHIGRVLKEPEQLK